MKLEPTVRRDVERILSGIMYEEKTLPIIEDTIDKIRKTVGEDYFVAYTKDGDAVNAVKFVLGKKGDNGEFTIWTIEVGPQGGLPKSPDRQISP